MRQSILKRNLFRFTCNEDQRLQDPQLTPLPQLLL